MKVSFLKKVAKYQNTKAFKFCNIEFVSVYLVTKSLAVAGIFFLNNHYILKLLIISIIMFDMQYWKCYDICNM